MTRSLRVAIPLALILAIFLTLIACTTDPPSQNRTASNQANQAESEAAKSVAAPQCNPDDAPGVRVDALKKHFLRHGTNDADLERQRANGYYKVDFVTRGDAVVLQVQGRVTGEGEDGPGPSAPKASKLKHLIQKLDWYMKKGCADIASFEKLSASTATGFEWSICESPEEPCESGRCALPGQCKRNGNNNTGNVMNGNTNLQPLANTGANANSNSTSNRTSNSASP